MHELTVAVTAGARPADVQSTQNSITESGDGYEILTISD